MASIHDTYTSPLASRNASASMLRLWSARHKFNTWRRIWLAVAEAQTRMASTYVNRERFSLPVTAERVEEMRSVVGRGITDDEIRSAERYERDLRHDVMAHVHAFGDSCPRARGIIHLGLTSQDVVCNADWAITVQSLGLLHAKCVRLVVALADFAQRHSRVATLGFTHYQPAQPVTVGRRAAQWASDVLLVAGEVRGSAMGLRPRGFKGATGTQASFLELFGGDHTAVDLFEQDAVGRLFLSVRGSVVGPAGGGAIDMLDRDCSYDFSLDLTTQTYPRVLDAMILSRLASVAAVLHKIATDIRLLSNRKEMDEPFEDKQVGSSAMPYKRNPMRCERICGLSRFVMNLVGNAYDTAATQWLERTLDDSSNRRLSLPEAFLALDGALDLMHNVVGGVVTGSEGKGGLIVHEAMVRKNLMGELPFMASENILMACVRAGGDRQEYHEKIRVHAQAAGWRVKHEGLDNDLLERLKNDKAFWGKARGGQLEVELDWSEGPGGLLDPMRYVGRSVEQSEQFLREVVGPLREQYKDAIAGLGESGPRV